MRGDLWDGGRREGGREGVREEEEEEEEVGANLWDCSF